MRWIVLTRGGELATLAWFVKVRYTVQGRGNVLFAQSDLQGDGRPDVFAVFGDDLRLARHLRDDIFNYSIFAGGSDGGQPAPLMEATFESRDEAPGQIVESMQALDGSTLRLSFRELGLPRVYVREVRKGVMETGAFAVPSEYSLTINDRIPVGEPDKGPVSDAPPLGADLQNLRYAA
jgi:hypothetical protein